MEINDFYSEEEKAKTNIYFEEEEKDVTGYHRFFFESETLRLKRLNKEFEILRKIIDNLVAENIRVNDRLTILERKAKPLSSQIYEKYKGGENGI